MGVTIAHAANLTTTFPGPVDSNLNLATSRRGLFVVPMVTSNSLISGSFHYGTISNGQGRATTKSCSSEHC